MVSNRGLDEHKLMFIRYIICANYESLREDFDAEGLEFSFLDRLL